MRAALALVGAAVLALLAAAPAAALTADEIYEPGAVVVIDLTLPPASIAALEADPEGDYVEGEFSLAPSDGTPAGVGAFSPPIAVGVRLKGESSFRPLSGKAAFKLKFNEFVKGQKFLGLKKMTLNNLVEDPSMVHETLAYQAFRAAGVPAPRTGYADVRVNGVEYGLHLNLETLDEVALKRLFGDFGAPPQHLYEGAFGVDVVPGDAGLFEVDEGEEGGRSDLEALIAAVAAPSPPSFSARVAAVADLEEMTRMWAVERYIGHWDGYSGRSLPHNYYLYSDPAGVFQMLPWGTDQTWSQPQLGFGPPGPALFEACFDDGSCRAAYLAALREAAAAVSGLDPGAEASELGDLLAPWQALEAAPRKPFDASQIAAAVAAVGQFAAARPGQLQRWLEPPAPPEEPAGHGGGGSSGGAPEIWHRLPLNRAKLGRGVLLTWAHAPAAGSLSLSAAIATRAGPVSACAARVRAADAAQVALRCRLSPRVRRHLAKRWIKLRLRLEVALDAGTTATLSRSVRLARTEPTAAGGVAQESRPEV
ncbi:MAG TPA: CotH kinase family protein [Solirubrobacterales bacterium]|nr:CotH kinase family protein [Solirubrobacterales bacterium]